MATTEKKAPQAAAKPATKPTAPKGLQMKLLALQKAVQGLKKDSHADAFKGGRGYDYLSGDKLLSVVRPAMDTLGLRLLQDMDTDKVQFSASGAAIIPFIFTWVDAETGEREEHRWLAAGSNSPVDKAIGSATTYAERYFLMKSFHLQTDCDDTDALQEADFQPQTRQAEPAPAPAPAPKVSRADLLTLPEGMQGLTSQQYTQYVANVAAGLRDASEVEQGFRDACGAPEYAIGVFRSDVKNWIKQHSGR